MSRDPQPERRTLDRDKLKSIEPGVLEKIRKTLIEQESFYQHNFDQEALYSLWTHSYRVGRMAQHIAIQEGYKEEPALLAGLLHDIGKFAQGRYHDDGIPEEENALGFVETILSGTSYERLIPMVKHGIRTMYLSGESDGYIAGAVHDADCLDKLGHIGVAQFFTKKALRRHFLDDDLMIQTSIELTYAHHAPETLKTATGRSLAHERSIRTRRFYTELLEEWVQLGLGSFKIIEEDIAGIVCVLMVPCKCSCGARLEVASDIRDALKCRSVVVSIRCVECATRNDLSFCLPNVKDLPLK